MNTELRNKLFNKMKNVFENEDTQEREAYLQARENGLILKYSVMAQSILQKKLLQRSYPTEDVAILKNFQKEIWKSL